VTTETEKVTIFSKWMIEHQLVRMWNCEWQQKQIKLQCLVNECFNISWSDVNLRVTKKTDNVTIFSELMFENQQVRMWYCEWQQKQINLLCLKNECLTISWSGCKIASENRKNIKLQCLVNECLKISWSACEIVSGNRNRQTYYV
jgi:hypothetical protein